MSENILGFARTQSYTPPKKPLVDDHKIGRTQSLDTGADNVKMSIDSMYNQAVHYHKIEKNLELAEAAFRAALRMNPNHVQSLLGLGALLKDELHQETEGIELLHKATGLIMCPQTLPGEDKLRNKAVARAGSFKNVFGQEVKAAPLESHLNVPEKPLGRMGSMKAVLAAVSIADKGKKGLFNTSASEQTPAPSVAN